MSTLRKPVFIFKVRRLYGRQQKNCAPANFGGTRQRKAPLSSCTVFTYLTPCSTRGPFSCCTAGNRRTNQRRQRARRCIASAAESAQPRPPVRDVTCSHIFQNKSSPKHKQNKNTVSSRSLCWAVCG
ncbi:hypothetical protein F2P81_003705 [Scophthalmus maximus]|uniref:Uncharacterized protein n=1 Tax=Scophthalmus maximus TaxID=52904 RepID=A0A6A4TDC3_SCOMX|nr:hypothetical protein F2P81_003705 [Scophthalmus maximus]